MTLFLVNVLLAALWVILWGDLSLYTIAVGFAFGYAVLWLFARTVSRGGEGAMREAYGRRVIGLVRFAGHFAWLLVKSNWQIAREVVTPGMGISPRILRYEVTGLNDAETTALSNAITLTPGTLVVDVRDSEGGRRHLYVHAIYAADRARAEADLDRLRRRMEREVFGR